MAYIELFAPALGLLAATLVILHQLQKRMADRRAFQLFAASILGWYVISLVAGWPGFFNVPVTEADFFPGYMVMATLMSAGAFPILLYMKVPAIRAGLHQLPIRLLLGVQLYRLGGFVFIIAAYRGTLPINYGLFVGIFDIFIAVIGIYLALGAKNWPQKRIVGFSLAGITDFMIAIVWFNLMFPFPGIGSIIGYDNTIAGLGYWPLSYIALYAVPMSICLHLLTIQRAKEELKD